MEFRLQNHSSSPPLGQENSSFEPPMQQNQMNQMVPPNFNQFQPQMMNYPQPPGYSGEMYGANQMNERKGAPSQPAKDSKLFFSESQFLSDGSSGNIPHAQIDPSPTAEKLVPGFINEDHTPEDNKNYGTFW